MMEDRAENLYDAERQRERAEAERQRERAEAERERMREALRIARHPCAIAASYVDDKNISIGLKLHAESCVAALRAIDAALANETKGER